MSKSFEPTTALALFRKELSKCKCEDLGEYDGEEADRLCVDVDFLDELIENLTDEDIKKIDNIKIFINLNKFPQNIGMLKYLRELNVQFKDYYQEETVIPDNICNLEYIKKIQIWNNIHPIFSNNMKNLKNLKILDLGPYGGMINELPTWLNGMNITNLALCSKNISIIPNWISNLKNLEILNLSFNKIYKIPESIAKLPNLKHLDLTENPIFIYPDMSVIENLKIPDYILSYYDDQDFPIEDIIDDMTDEEILSVKELFISDYRRESSPMFAKFQNLEYLKIRNNNKIPDFISQLVNLTQLDLSNNKLTQVPNFISQLVNLTDLDLTKNNIGSYPDFIADMEDLAVVGDKYIKVELNDRFSNIILME